MIQRRKNVFVSSVATVFTIVFQKKSGFNVQYAKVGLTFGALTGSYTLFARIVIPIRIDILYVACFNNSSVFIV